MLVYWITLPLVGVSIVAIFVVLRRHWKEIRLLNPDSIKEERQRQTREQLITKRFERVKSMKLAPIKAVLNKSVFLAKTGFHSTYIKLIQLDRFYKQAKAPFAHLAPSVKDRIKTAMDDARSLARDLKWADAERRYLEVLAIDNRNADAYKGLGSIYLKQKLYPQAKETYEFLVKSKKADDNCYSALGEIAEAEGETDRAEKMYRKALDLQPRLAHRYATLAQFYLTHGDLAQAWPLIKRATELEQKSPKYIELSIDVALALGDRNEARRRYDALRLVVEDRQKLQAVKDRIDAASA